MLIKKTPSFYYRIFFLIIGLSLVSIDSVAGGLQSEMDKLFNDMSNTTSPGIYETQRRGVISSGRYTTKSRIFDENPISFTPPSWKAGCGGVDLFGGALSFINADQLVQLLRSIAANAKGYAFQLALDNVFPDGAKWIENFQKKIQELNEQLSNSCQLAQGFVNDMTSGMNLKHKTDASLSGTMTGLYGDFFDSKQEMDGENPMEKLKANNPTEYNKLIGNIVWKQLNENNVSSWFEYGDKNLLEAIMSLTGTVIIGDIEKDPNISSSSTSQKTTPITTLPGNKITLSDLISGGSFDVYSCDGDEENCLKAGSNNKTIKLKGIKDKITELLLGTDSQVGIVYKYANNTGELKESEKAFVTNLPGGIGTIIRNLAVLSQDSSTLFIQESAGSLALAMMYNFTEEFFRATRISLANNKSPYLKKVLTLLNQSQQQIRSEYTVLSSQYGDLSSQIKKYNDLLENVRKQRYMLTTLSKTDNTNH